MSGTVTEIFVLQVQGGRPGI